MQGSFTGLNFAYIYNDETLTHPFLFKKIFLLLIPF